MLKNKYIFLSIGLLLATPIRASAYIDMGLAGQFFQITYLVFIGILTFVLSPILFFWKQIRRRLFSRKNKNVEQSDEQ